MIDDSIHSLLEFISSEFKEQFIQSINNQPHAMNVYSPDNFIKFVIPSLQDEFIEQFNLVFNRHHDEPVGLKKFTQNLVEWCEQEQGISAEDLFGNTRIQKVVYARHIVMFTIYEYGKGLFSMKQVADVFNRKSHCIVHHAIKKCKENYGYDKNLSNMMDGLCVFLSKRGYYLLEKYVEL